MPLLQILTQAIPVSTASNGPSQCSSCVALKPPIQEHSNLNSSGSSTSTFNSTVRLLRKYPPLVWIYSLRILIVALVLKRTFKVVFIVIFLVVAVLFLVVFSRFLSERRILYKNIIILILLLMSKPPLKTD